MTKATQRAQWQNPSASFLHLRILLFNNWFLCAIGDGATDNSGIYTSERSWADDPWRLITRRPGILLWKLLYAGPGYVAVKGRTGFNELFTFGSKCKKNGEPALPVTHTKTVFLRTYPHSAAAASQAVAHTAFARSVFILIIQLTASGTTAMTFRAILS